MKNQIVFLDNDGAKLDSIKIRNKKDLKKGLERWHLKGLI